jgi:small-conductance mechanosensitive channel
MQNPFQAEPADQETENETASSIPDPDIESFGDLGNYIAERFVSYGEAALALAPRLIIVVVILLITWGIARLVRMAAGFATRRTGMRQSLTDLIKTLTGLLVRIVGIFMAMSVLFPSINPGSILTGLGVGGIIIGIAFQDIFKNFMAGVLILARRTMAIGDYIETTDVEGRIEHITLRDTYLRRVDGELVLVPNAHLFENPVRVWTDPTYRRYDIVVGVGYGEDAAAAREVIQEAMNGLDFGSGKAPQVFAASFGSSSIDYNVRWWAEPEPLDMHTSRNEVVLAVKKALDDAGIEIPFPYRTLTFAEPLRLDQDMKSPESGGESR